MAAILNNNVHQAFAPVLAAITSLPVAAEQPIEVRRAGYVARLARMDWQHQFSDSHAAVVAVRMELEALKALRDEVDPDHQLWERHAPEWAWASVPVHTLTDFAGDCPATVEWMATVHGPRLIAVVVDVVGAGPKRIDQALSQEVMKRLFALVGAAARAKGVR